MRSRRAEISRYELCSGNLCLKCLLHNKQAPVQPLQLPVSIDTVSLFGSMTQNVLSSPQHAPWDKQRVSSPSKHLFSQEGHNSSFFLWITWPPGWYPNSGSKFITWVVAFRTWSIRVKTKPTILNHLHDFSKKNVTVLSNLFSIG